MARRSSPSAAAPRSSSSTCPSPGCRKELPQRLPLEGLRPQQAVEVRLFPGAGAVVFGEGLLLVEEGPGVEAAAAVRAPHLVLAVQHLVEDDPRYEEPGHVLLIQRGVDANDAILDGEAAHLDRAPAAALDRARPPSDARLQLAV